MEFYGQRWEKNSAQEVVKLPGAQKQLGNGLPANKYSIMALIKLSITEELPAMLLMFLGGICYGGASFVQDRPVEGRSMERLACRGVFFNHVPAAWIDAVAGEVKYRVYMTE